MTNKSHFDIKFDKRYRKYDWYVWFITYAKKGRQEPDFGQN